MVVEFFKINKSQNIGSVVSWTCSESSCVSVPVLQQQYEVPGRQIMTAVWMDLQARNKMATAMQGEQLQQSLLTKETEGEFHWLDSHVEGSQGSQKCHGGVCVLQALHLNFSSHSCGPHTLSRLPFQLAAESYHP